MGIRILGCAGNCGLPWQFAGRHKTIFPAAIKNLNIYHSYPKVTYKKMQIYAYVQLPVSDLCSDEFTSRRIAKRAKNGGFLTRFPLRFAQFLSRRKLETER